MKKSLLVVLTILLSVGFVFSQTTSGRLLGTVSGPDGVLPNATVKAKDNKTGKELTVTSNEDGSFLFPQLEFGTYTVSVSVQGFKTFVANEVKIDVGRDYSLTPTLEIGSVQETVNVTAGAEVVTSTSAQITNTVSPQQIMSLPLLTRNPLDVTTLQAGTADNDFTNTSINGMRTTFTNITRDGINIQDAFIRSNATDFAPGRPSVDDTGEFTISTGNQEADQGYGGAQIRLVTPRGTKDLHGALFAYNRNSAFGANNFFNNRAVSASNPNGIARPFRNRNQFGGKVSGALPLPHFGEGGPYFEKDKGFYFFAYEGIRDPQPATTNLNRTILTPLARAGGFAFTRAADGIPINSGGVSCPSGTSGSTCTITNLLTFAQSQGLAVPGAIDPIIQSRIIDKLPTTSNFAGGDTFNTAGYRTTRAANQTRNTFTTRIDVDATEKDNFNGVYSYNKETNLRPDADLYSFGTVPGVNQFSANHMFVAAYRRIISSNIINEARGGIFMSEVPFDRTDPLPPFLFAASGANGILSNLFQGNVFQGGIVSNPENNFLSQGRNTQGVNFQDNVDWIVGKHSFRFGGQLQYFKVNSYNDAGIIPTVVIAAGGNTPALVTGNFANQCNPAPCAAGATSLINATQLATGNNLLALFGGLVNTATQNFNLRDISSGFQPTRQLSPYRYSNHSLYFSDRWSALRGLTVSMGLRYELFPAMKLANGLALEPVYANNDDPIPSLLNINGTTNVVGTNAGETNAYYKTDFDNFAPSIGVAYTPNFKSGIGKFLFGSEGKSVLRGGYSRVYGNDSIVTSINNAAVGNPGLAGTRNTLVNLNARVSGALPNIAAPAFAAPPRTYLLNNAQNNFFGTVFGIDPNIEIPMVEQYSFGYQREFFDNWAFEIRYVGSRSSNLVRGVDINQINIFNNGFLADFNRALANFRQTGDPFCVAAGCQALTIFQQSAGSAGRLGVAPTAASTPAGTIARNTFLTHLQNGAPADLALAYINSAANLNNHPSSINPTASPFIGFVANPAAGAIDLMINDAGYNYNSLQIELRRRFAGGLYLQANYTFAKNLTNAIGTGQTLFEPYLDNNNKDLDKQRADFDQTHTFNFNGIYQLPFGKGKMFLNNGGAMDKIFGGWEVSGIAQWTSGAPITFVDTRGTLNRTGRSARQTPISSLTNDEIRNLSGIFERDGKIFFVNPAVINASGQASAGFGTTPFSGQVFISPGPGQTGNVTRALVNGPKYFNVNMALLKNIRFTETMRVQLRAEAFNVLNNTNFAFLTAAEQVQLITATTFGTVSTARTPRTMQFAFRFEF